MGFLFEPTVTLRDRKSSRTKQATKENTIKSLNWTERVNSTRSVLKNSQSKKKTKMLDLYTFENTSGNTCTQETVNVNIHITTTTKLFFLIQTLEWIANPWTPESGFQKQLHLHAMLHYHMTLGIIAGHPQTPNLRVLCSAVAAR